MMRIRNIFKLSTDTQDVWAFWICSLAFAVLFWVGSWRLGGVEVIHEIESQAELRHSHEVPVANLRSSVASDPFRALAQARQARAQTSVRPSPPKQKKAAVRIDLPTLSGDERSFVPTFAVASVEDSLAISFDSPAGGPEPESYNLARLEIPVEPMFGAQTELRSIEMAANSLDGLQVTGQMDPKEIQRVIVERLHEIRYCYELALLKTPQLEGQVDAFWTISGQGSVTQVSSSSRNASDDILENCMREKIRAWKFPLPVKGGVRVQFPFLLRRMGT